MRITGGLKSTTEKKQFFSTKTGRGRESRTDQQKPSRVRGGGGKTCGGRGDKGAWFLEWGDRALTGALLTLAGHRQGVLFHGGAKMKKRERELGCYGLQRASGCGVEGIAKGKDQLHEMRGGDFSETGKMDTGGGRNR